MLLRSFGPHASRAAALRAAAPASAGLAGARRSVAASAEAGAGAGYALNVSGAVDKAHEAKSFKEIAKLPPGALQGLKEDKADALLAKLGVKTVADLGSFRHFRTARALASLAKREQDAARPPGARSNVNRAVDKAWEAKSLREIVAAPPSALQGLTPESDETLKALGVKTVGDLAKWKYCVWAESIGVLAGLESEDFESR
jgi:hypothetical protein